MFAADTLSIAVMEITDNLVMALIPGAMDAGLVNPIFWIGMMIALAAAFVAAFPVNRYLIDKGKGHALTHQFHEGHQAHGTHGEHASKPRAHGTGPPQTRGTTPGRDAIHHDHGRMHDRLRRWPDNRCTPGGAREHQHPGRCA